MLKAIETHYKGYRFRSRLEACWAVFFDALGVKWQYEPEGFHLSNGEWYLPDFYVEDFGGGGYLEVKPEGPIEEAAKTKMMLLSKGLNKEGYILNGPPDFKYYAYCGISSDEKALLDEGVLWKNLSEKELDSWICKRHYLKSDKYTNENDIAEYIIDFKDWIKNGSYYAVVFCGNESNYECAGGVFVDPDDYIGNSVAEHLFWNKYIDAVYASRAARF